MDPQLDKAEKISVSLRRSQIEWLNSLEGKRSPHLQRLVDSAMAAEQKTDTTPSTALEDLAATFTPTRTKEIHDWCTTHDVPQDRLVAQLIDLFADGIKMTTTKGTWRRIVRSLHPCLWATGEPAPFTAKLTDI